MSVQKIDDTRASQVVGAVVTGGNQYRSGLDASGIQFGRINRPGGIYNGYLSDNTGASFITGTTIGAVTGVHLGYSINSANPIIDRSINFVESVSGLNYSSVIIGYDGAIYASDGSAGGTPTVTKDSFGTDNAAREGWNTPVVNVQHRSVTPATGYYDLH